MTTPICDFVRAYIERETLRLHMPGHKGQGLLGFEACDITEIHGADSLYEAEGIIWESEKNASDLFGCPTYYSTEGSSQCIRAMLYLAVLHARGQGIDRPLIAAGRNAHKTFLSAAALLDLDVVWLYPDRKEAYLSCDIDGKTLERFLCEAGTLPIAVYLTSPDYLGNVLLIEELADVCHRHGVLLLVDNAHGAYLKFLPGSRYPMDLGADMCCDSAHKTLPVLTGGAYLHIARHAPRMFTEQAGNALAMFGSTSPSYLILQSLDAVNAVLSDKDFIDRLVVLTSQIAACRVRLTTHGINASCGNEPLKLTVYPRQYGYTGTELAALLRGRGIECEFADPDYVVFMFTPAISKRDIERLTETLLAIPRRCMILTEPPLMCRPRRAMSIREATFSYRETLSVEHCLGRVLATLTVGCPPAVPIVTSGEIIDEDALRCLEYYGIETCDVVVE